MRKEGIFQEFVLFDIQFVDFHKKEYVLPNKLPKIPINDIINAKSKF